MKKFDKSTAQLSRAELSIPLGSQTFSKSKTQYPVGISPLYASKSKGAYLWDIDGNKYIDLVNSLAAVTLGYGDKGLEKSILKQLKLGVSLSLPTKIESEVAELIIELVPSAEMVRFSKNGSDATSAAIRLARAFTGRDQIVACGYHGWHDWYIGTTSRNKGIPTAVSTLTHNFQYNDIESLKSALKLNEGKVAAVIIEPMNDTYPQPGFLEEVQVLAKKAGAVLIFDEVITGFRFSEGGAQKLFDVTPDLATFGKGIANGFPLSAVVGRREIMKEMEHVFISGTFGGELLSLAAARYVLKKHQKNEICGDLVNKGNVLSEFTNKLIDSFGLSNVVSLSGHPTWKFLRWNGVDEYSAAEIKTLFMQEIFQEGVLVLNSHNISQAHDKKIIVKIIDAYSKVFGRIEKAISQGNLREELHVSPLVPLFRVR
jgi:glutamate-1-semialdehyde aminotransferase